MTQEIVEFDSNKYKWKEIPGEGKCLVPIKERELVSWDEIPWGSFFEFQTSIFLKVQSPDNKSDAIWIIDRIGYKPVNPGFRCVCSPIYENDKEKRFYIRDEFNGVFPC